MQTSTICSAFKFGDVKTGKIIQTVQVEGYGWSRARLTGHGCLSHGIALSPDETVVAQLKDETGREVQSEKAVEVLFNPDGRIAKTVDQFGVGQVRAASN
jgi:hypothetical protein